MRSRSSSSCLYFSVPLSLLCLFLFFSFPSVTGINTYLSANSEKCFFESAKKGEKVYGSFSVTSGGTTTTTTPQTPTHGTRIEHRDSHMKIREHHISSGKENQCCRSDRVDSNRTNTSECSFDSLLFRLSFCRCFSCFLVRLLLFVRFSRFSRLCCCSICHSHSHSCFRSRFLFPFSFSGFLSRSSFCFSPLVEVNWTSMFAFSIPATKSFSKRIARRIILSNFTLK